MAEEVLYPWGYSRALVTMPRMKELARFDLMEAEEAERLEAWLVSRGGKIGIGGAVRFVQPDKEGFADPGKSFHELQQWEDGQNKFCAVDLVVRNGTNVHRAPYWSEVPQQGTAHPDITDYGVHCNVPGEPWHMQPIEIDGWQTWVTNGRKHPNPNFPIKGAVPVPVQTVPPLASRTLMVAAPTMHGGDVLWIQNLLKTKGGLSMSADGYYGIQTRDKVKIFQGWEGLTQDGVVGPKTWEAFLRSA